MSRQLLAFTQDFIGGGLTLWMLANSIRWFHLSSWNHRAVQEFYYNLRPFVPYGLVVFIALDTVIDRDPFQYLWLRVIIAVTMLFVWFKSDGDDRWKRRRRRLARRVTVTGGKLAVVPTDK